MHTSDLLLLPIKMFLMDGRQLFYLNFLKIHLAMLDGKRQECVFVVVVSHQKQVGFVLLSLIHNDIGYNFFEVGNADFIFFMTDKSTEHWKDDERHITCYRVIASLHNDNIKLVILFSCFGTKKQGIFQNHFGTYARIQHAKILKINRSKKMHTNNYIIIIDICNYANAYELFIFLLCKGVINSNFLFTFLMRLYR